MKRKHPGGKQKYKRGKFSVQDGGQGKLQAGMLGVLVSHDRNKEKFCRLDSFAILNHFADEMYGPEQKPDSPSDSDCDDIEKLLSKEAENIQASCDTKVIGKRRFSAMKSGCNNLVFIRFRNEISPSELVDKMVTCLSSRERVQNENVPLVRNVLRIHPVEFSCSAYIDTMRKNIPHFLVKKLSDIEDTVKSKEYNITFKSRNNTHLDKEIVKTDLFKDIQDSLSGWKFNCRTDSVWIIIDVVCVVSLVSVVKDYFKFKKYNVNQLLLQSSGHEEKSYVKPVDSKMDSDVSTNDKIAEVLTDTKAINAENQSPHHPVGKVDSVGDRPAGTSLTSSTVIKVADSNIPESNDAVPSPHGLNEKIDPVDDTLTNSAVIKEAFSNIPKLIDASQSPHTTD